MLKLFLYRSHKTAVDMSSFQLSFLLIPIKVAHVWSTIRMGNANWSARFSDQSTPFCSFPTRQLKKERKLFSPKVVATSSANVAGKFEKKRQERQLFSIFAKDPSYTYSCTVECTHSLSVHT